MDGTRYFHNNGLSVRENGKWVSCAPYTGEPYTLPLRVTIPQGEENAVTEDDVSAHRVKYPLYQIGRHQTPEMQEVIAMYNAGKTMSYIGSHFKQHPSTIKKMLEGAGIVKKHERVKKGAKNNG